MAKVYVVFYSMYGHIYRMAEAVAEGARSVEGAQVSLFQTEELVPETALERTGAKAAREAFAHVPVIEADQLADADALIFGTPTRFGNMAAQMRNLFDQTGRLWGQGALINKVGSVFTSTGSQHGGQESTLLSVHITLLHHGMLVVGVPYAEEGLTTMDEISGGTPYGATTITGGDGSRWPSENELKIARYQGKHVAQVTRRFADG